MKAGGRTGGFSWVQREAANAGGLEDRVVLENPIAVASLDARLRDAFPLIRAELEKTGFRYLPTEEDLHIDSTGLGPNLARSLTCMLFDDLDRPFMRCSIQCDRRGYMVEREFHLGLPETTDPRFLFRILSDPRFAGNVPSLTIERSVSRPQWRSHYWIQIQAGSGFISGPWTMDTAAIGDIRQSIGDSCQMYSAGMARGFLSMEEVERFLDIACRSFESG